MDATARFDDVVVSLGDTALGNIDQTTIRLNTGVGHRVNDGIFEPGVALFVEWIDADIEDTTVVPHATTSVTQTTVGIGPNLRVWALTTGSVRPWVEGAAGFAYARLDQSGYDDSATGFFVQGRLGASFFASESVSIDIGFGASGTSVSTDELDVDFDYKTFDFVAGIATYF